MALMMHHTNLATWFVRTIGTVAAILIVPPIIGALIGAVSGESFFLGLGAVVSTLALLAYLTSATAPVPSPAIIALLEADDDPEPEDGA
jgi:hypothetical protein